MFHVCFGLCVGICVDVCGVVCVVEWCLFLASECCFCVVVWYNGCCDFYLICDRCSWCYFYG